MESAGFFILKTSSLKVYYRDTKHREDGRMRKIITLVVFILSSLTLAGPVTYGSAIVDSVLRVYDGDTFYANLKDMPPIVGENIGIRVRGVDTPEIRGKCVIEKSKAKAARDYVVSLIKEARKIELREIQRGKYFRIVATVIIDGVDLSDRLIEMGYAVPYDGGAKGEWCENN